MYKHDATTRKQQLFLENIGSVEGVRPPPARKIGLRCSNHLNYSTEIIYSVFHEI